MYHKIKFLNYRYQKYIYFYKNKMLFNSGSDYLLNDETSNKPARNIPSLDKEKMLLNSKLNGSSIKIS